MLELTEVMGHHAFHISSVLSFGTSCLSYKLRVELMSHTKNHHCVLQVGLAPTTPLGQVPMLSCRAEQRVLRPMLVETEQTPELFSTGSASQTIIFTGKNGRLAQTQLSDQNPSNCSMPRGCGYEDVGLGWCWLGCF